MFQAEVSITLKRTVADPQGQTVKHALESLGYKGIQRVGMGKFVTVELDAEKKEKAEADLHDMCKKLLTNPIIEEYQFSLREA